MGGISRVRHSHRLFQLRNCPGPLLRHLGYTYPEASVYYRYCHYQGSLAHYQQGLGTLQVHLLGWQYRPVIQQTQATVHRARTALERHLHCSLR